MPSIIGSVSCSTGSHQPVLVCCASALFALFLIGGSFPPRGRCSLARPILRPAWSRRYLFKFQHGLGHRRILHQSKELVIGGASHLFKNSRTQQVATEIDLTGKLASPGVSTWQAFMQVLHNAFIEAILPGFDRAVRPNTITK